MIYRTIPGFIVQFGVAADPSVQALWQDNKIVDDEQKNIPFSAGSVSFAGNGKDSRSSHIFIALEPHGKTLGKSPHERPFGQITKHKEQQMVFMFV